MDTGNAQGLVSGRAFEPLIAPATKLCLAGTLSFRAGKTSNAPIGGLEQLWTDLGAFVDCVLAEFTELARGAVIEAHPD